MISGVEREEQETRSEKGEEKDEQKEKKKCSSKKSDYTHLDKRECVFVIIDLLGGCICCTLT